MTVKEIDPQILVLEYRQERDDEDYGTCLWARFYFNLEKYELLVTSDCGDFAYGWVATPDTEKFLKLMARIDKDYLIQKFCGNPKEFDYQATKDRLYDYWGEEQEDREKLDEIFDDIENYGEPESGETFIRLFEEANDGTFCDAWEMPVYGYSPWQERIVQIFEDCIQPKIKEILKND